MKAFDLRGKRQSARIRIEPVAAALGFNAASVTDIERGRIGIDMETYQEISGVIDRLVADRETQKEVIA